MKGMVTGFDAFGSLDANPSSALAEWLASEESSLTASTLPTSFSRGWGKLDTLLADGNFDFAILFGYAKGAHGLRLERSAANKVRQSAKDNDGNTPSEVISSDGPLMIQTPFDVNALRKLVETETGCTTEESVNAGGYVCNYVYFRTLREHPETPSLFVHISSMEDSPEFEILKAGARSLIHALEL